VNVKNGNTLLSLSTVMLHSIVKKKHVKNIWRISNVYLIIHHHNQVRTFSNYAQHNCRFPIRVHRLQKTFLITSC